MMASADVHAVFLFAFVSVLSMTASTAQGTSCAFGHLPPKISSSCECSDTSLICNMRSWPWPWEEIPKNTTSLKISGTDTTDLIIDAGIRLKNLTKLDLTNNTLSNITNGSFSERMFPALKELTLDQNNLTLSGGAEIFTSVSAELQVLSLDRALNDDYRIVMENLRDIMNKTNFGNLEVLRLDNNNIVLLAPFTQLSTTFKLPKLKKFTLRNSSLIAIRKGTFQKRVFPQLKYLDLRDNELKNIGKPLIKYDFNSFTDLNISLSGNPFYCNCHLIDFRTWLRQTDLVMDKENVMCADAVNKTSVGRPVVQSSLQCVPGPEELDIEDELAPSYIILSVILGLVGVLALIVLYMRRNDIKDYFVDIYTTTKEAFNSRQGYDDINRVRRDTPEMTPTEV